MISLTNQRPSDKSVVTHFNPRSFTAFRMTTFRKCHSEQSEESLLSRNESQPTNFLRRKTMADDNYQPSEEEITLMLRRAGLTLPPEQLERCCAVVARLEAAARRLRNDLKRTDEPASVFILR
jgi:hypothetical protein